MTAIINQFAARARSLATPLVIAVVVLMLVAGCTQRQSRTQYEERLAKAVAERTIVTQQIDADELRSAEDWQQAQQRIAKVLVRLDADPPPKEVSSAHESMIKGLEALAVLAQRRGRCERQEEVSVQDGRACKQAIPSSVYDEIRNDFEQADTLYRSTGYVVDGLGGGTGGNVIDDLDDEGNDEL